VVLFIYKHFVARIAAAPGDAKASIFVAPFKRKKTLIQRLSFSAFFISSFHLEHGFIQGRSLLLHF
jgi:hypothetical protein